MVGGGPGRGKEAHHAGAAPEQDTALFVHVVHLALEVPTVAQGHPEALAGEKRGGGVPVPPPPITVMLRIIETTSSMMLQG